MKSTNNNKPDKSRLWKAVIFLALLTLLFYIFFYMTGVHTICYTRAITGIPCPGCGMTRAWKAFFHLDIKMAFFYHPLFLMPALIAVFLYLQYYRDVKIPKWIWSVMLIIFLAVYAIRMVLCFPDKEPMTYNQYAYLPRLIHFLSALMTI